MHPHCSGSPFSHFRTATHVRAHPPTHTHMIFWLCTHRVGAHYDSCCHSNGNFNDVGRVVVVASLPPRVGKWHFIQNVDKWTRSFSTDKGKAQTAILSITSYNHFNLQTAKEQSCSTWTIFVTSLLLECWCSSLWVFWTLLFIPSPGVYCSGKILDDLDLCSAHVALNAIK